MQIWPPENYVSLPDRWSSTESSEIPLSRLAALTAALSPVPYIWLPRTSGGHTRQYFPIHEAGIVKPTGSAVFDTFATIAKSQPLLFHWPEVALDGQQQSDLNLVLERMTYFGRAESWSRVQAYMTSPEQIDGVVIEGPARTHWRCVCIEDHSKPEGREYRDYTLERRLAAIPVNEGKTEVVNLLPRTKMTDGKDRKATAVETLRTILQRESPEKAFLRCLIRESGQDIKDGLERPIGTRWVHYAVPRAIYDIPPRRFSLGFRRKQTRVEVVRFALNTATIHRAVLPPVTDTLLVADRFRSAALAVCSRPSRNLSGHELNGTPCRGHQHAFCWPTDEDNDGFIDHVTVYCPAGFESHEADALRRLHRLRQRGGRPDLLVTPVYAGSHEQFAPWSDAGHRATNIFVSATPYFCPLYLGHGKSGGRLRRIKPEITRALMEQRLIESEHEVVAIEELVFDYDPEQFARLQRGLLLGEISEPVPPRQYFPLIAPPTEYPPLPKLSGGSDVRYPNAALKDPDMGYPFGLSVGLFVDGATRFVRALSFCRRRRDAEVKGGGRMLRITFREPRPPHPFAIGSQCHFGLGLLVPERPQ